MGNYLSFIIPQLLLYFYCTYYRYAKLSEMERGAKRSSTESVTGQLLAKKWKDTKIENGMIYNENLPE